MLGQIVQAYGFEIASINSSTVHAWSVSFAAWAGVCSATFIASSSE